MRYLKFISVMLISGASAMTSATDIPSLVTDINQTVTAGSIDHDGFVSSQGLVFFTHTTSTTGTELWRTDGTEAGTLIAADLVVGRRSSSPHELTDWNGRLYFSALLSSGDSGLWKTDGTEAGTELLAEVSSSFSPPRKLTPAGDQLFYVANLNILYATDGTDAGVQVSPPGVVASVNFPTALGNQLLFGYRGQLWISDGTPEGTVTLKDVPARELISLGSDRIVFWVEEIAGSGLDQLWVSDGTASGTVFVQEAQLASRNQNEAVSFGDYVVFIGFDPVTGSEPWITDGTADGTFMIKDIDVNGSERRPENLTVVGNYIYFNNGNELWRTDGTLSGTTLVANAAGNLDDATGYNGLLYFADNELLQSDGTAVGTGIAFDLDVTSDASPRGLSAANGWLWFSAFSPQTGEEIWRSDGTLAGTQVVSAIAGGTLGSDPQQLLGAGATLFFTADNNVNGRELWGSDSTMTGTFMLNDIYPGTSGSEPSLLIDGDGIAYFFIDADVPSDAELWRSDGTVAGTQLVRVLPNTSFFSGASTLKYFNDALWFGTGALSGDGVRFWTSDGTPAGTLPVITVPAQGLTRVTDIALAGDTIVFAVTSLPDNEHQLFRTDGTLTGTEQFTTVVDDRFGGLLSMTTLNDLIVFTNDRPGDFVGSRDLWSTDATAEGTTLLTPFPGEMFSVIQLSQLATLGDRVFFAANYDQSFLTDRELWMSDGTRNGTQEVFDIDSTGSSSPGELVATTDAVIFAASTPEAGRELWLSRGPDDTFQISDLFPGSEESDISGLFAVGGTVFFSANDNVNGEELWRSDGTLSGTRLAADVVPGSGGSNVADLAFVDGKLYFTADDGIHGHELWTLSTNIAPWFTAQPANTAIENIEYNYTAEVTDANVGDTLTLAIVDAPNGAQFDAQTGLFTWTPTSNQVGQFNFEIVVTDQDGEHATQTLRIEVLADLDTDTIPDVQDNCSIIANVDQRDTDGDGYGNLCDADLNGDGVVNFSDLSILANRFLSTDPDADFDGDGSVNFSDVVLLRDSFLNPPGPSGLVGTGE